MPLQKKDQQEILDEMKNLITRDLISLEIIRVPKKIKLNSAEEAEEYYQERVQSKMYLIDDLSQPYLIRISWTDVKPELHSIDPQMISEADQYELAESIQDVLRENLFPVNKSEFDVENLREMQETINKALEAQNEV